MIRDENIQINAVQPNIQNPEYERESSVNPQTPEQDKSLYENITQNNINTISVATNFTDDLLNSIDKNDLLQCGDLENLGEIHSQITFSQLLNSYSISESNSSNEIANKIPDRKIFPNLDEHDNEKINFELNLDPNNCNNGKNNWYFSVLLKKVFIRLDKPFYIDIVYLPKVKEQLYLRVMLVYVDDMASPVSRCDNHLCKDNTKDVNEKHSIVRCANNDVSYIGTVDGKYCEDRLALLVKLNYLPTSDEHTNFCKETIKLTFVCQNSCTGRKPTAAIFTVETSTQILSKKIMYVKVCSCPKRDKKKEEDNFLSKRKAEQDEILPPGKRPAKIMKIKEEPGTHKQAIMEDQSNQISLPGIRITGQDVQLTLSLPSIRIANKVMEYAFDAIAGNIANDCQNSEKNKKCLKDIKKLINMYNVQ